MVATKRRRSPTPLTTLQVAHRFITGHLGRDAFAPFTGTDARAYRVFVHAVELYPFANEQAIVAMSAAVYATRRGWGYQVDVLEVFVQAIPAVLDWSDAARLWPSICPTHPDLRPSRRESAWKSPAPPALPAGGDS